MGTTTKALKLLNFFSNTRPEIGLSEIARLAGRDKATTFRHLAELIEAGFVEQARRSKLYRLGPSVLRLANIREQTFPMKRAAARHLSELVESVRETAHITALQGTLLTPMLDQQSYHHSTRVFIDPAEVLPLHATASGSVVMAFGDAGLLEAVLAKPLVSKTDETQIDPVQIREKVIAAQKIGFGYSVGEFEKGVSSIAAPLFDEFDTCAGAVAVACPTDRMTPELESLIKPNLAKAAIALTQSRAGKIPLELAKIWAGIAI